MAVFTPVSLSDLQPFWASYHLGELAEAAPIAEGVQNTNYRLTTTHGTRYILTLLEKWVDAAALPFYVGAMAHLAAKGIACPVPQGTPPIRTLANRPAVVVSFLRGQQATTLTPAHAHQAGRALASLHLAAADFEGVHDNAYGAPHWPAWAARVATTSAPELVKLAAELAAAWPHHLPRGFVHGDYFPDNVFFDGEAVSGVIDFYFAATDLLAYDLAIALSAWSFDADNALDEARLHAFLSGYQAVRPLSVDEAAALPQLCQGASLRFSLSRLEDNRPPVAGEVYQPKNPSAYIARLAAFQALPPSFWIKVLAP